MTQLLQETESQIQFQILENEQITHRLGCQLPFFICFLTLFGTGLKIYVKWRGGGFATTPFLTPKITVKNQKKNFAFQIGHMEIGIVTKFGGVWSPF